MLTKFMSREGVQRVVGDQCQDGLKSTDGLDTAPARKRNGWFIDVVCLPSD